MYTDGTGKQSIEVTPVRSRVEVDRFAILPVPGDLEGFWGFERNGRSAVIPDAQFGNNIHTPTQRSGS